MVIEWLTFDVPLVEQAKWLEIEERVWSRYLERQPGFLGKEIWVEEDSASLVHAVIRWESMELWKKITQEQVDEVDQLMGDAWKPCTMKVYEVRRQS